VKRARQEELEEIRKHEVYVKVLVQECWDKTGKGPIGVRWVDVNKGDEETPELRSRLVAQEINRYKRDDLFAPTPPLEALKMMISTAVTEGIGYKKGQHKSGMKLALIDIRRAYFHAAARREVYVELLEGDREEGMCGRLLKLMYGTRDAAQNWMECYSTVMRELGFRVDKASPCMFYHEEKT